MAPRPWENLWEDGEASAVMFAILDSFIADIRRNGSVPVVMILPLQPDVFRCFMTGSDPGPVLQIEEYCRKREVLCFDSVEALASTVNRMEEIPELYSVHVSAKGNRLIAGLFGAFLRDNGLIGGETGDEPR
jgi:hypothetical protein